MSLCLHYMFMNNVVIYASLYSTHLHKIAFHFPFVFLLVCQLQKLPSTVKTEKTDFHNEDYDNEEHKHFDKPRVKRLRNDDSSPGHSRSPAPKEVEGIEPMKDSEVLTMLH